MLIMDILMQDIWHKKHSTYMDTIFVSTSILKAHMHMLKHKIWQKTHEHSNPHFMYIILPWMTIMQGNAQYQMLYSISNLESQTQRTTTKIWIYIYAKLRPD